MKKILSNLFSLSIILGMLACETSESIPADNTSHEAYFPLKTGRFVIYKILETKYSIVEGDKTEEYFLKELVADSSEDDYNNLTYVIHRFKMAQEDDEWKFDSAWSARRSGNQFVKVENNIPYVKLVLPLAEGKEWNGNAFNSKGVETYKMEEVHQVKSFNDMDFDSTLVQVQKRESSIISKDYRIEIYAKNVGLVYKKFVVTTNLQNTNNGTVDPTKIDNGIDLTQTIIGYGEE